ncbi:MAG TPA: hypothetical protein VFF02_11450 [Anaeromyxobacteraceae bacterium]|nr:hypothetical protein [Anaeromyxobacteraceae bacterium]
MRTPLLPILLAPLLLACGDDVVSYSAPVGITLKLRSSDVGAGNAVTLSKNITTEQGNPYGAFVNAATRALGRPPSRIAVTYLWLELLPSSSGVADLGQVFSGQVGVGFELAGAVYPAGVATSPVGVSFPMAAGFDSTGLGPPAWSDLLAGFPVVLDGTATSAFATGNDTADLQVTIGFEAFK